jgi:hypothetical protein
MLGDEELRNAALLVLANKQDLPGAAKPAELVGELGLGACQRQWHVQPCTATSGDGLYEGLDWLRTAASAVAKSSKR